MAVHLVVYIIQDRINGITPIILIIVAVVAIVMLNVIIIVIVVSFVIVVAVVITILLHVRQLAIQIANHVPQIIL
jgi:hypothetical protein